MTYMRMGKLGSTLVSLVAKIKDQGGLQDK